MRYRLNGNLLPLKEGEELAKEEVLVAIISPQEYKNTYEDKIHQKMLSKMVYNIQYCKADLLSDCVIGTFVIPSKANLIGEELGFGFYMTKDQFIFVDGSGAVEQMVNHMVEIQILDKTLVAHFLFEFMEYLIRDDVMFLQEYETKLSQMEEYLLDGKLEDFNRRILLIRKELLVLHSYYQQMADLSQVLEENQNHIFNKEDCRLFSLYAARVDRLYDNTQMLKEYSMQLREMYQSQIDLRQNKIMQFLTVVTTIFMPLTLIVGWYGMNFVNMPELHNANAYYIVIGVSISITLIEIWYFKVKKWFK
ncbi:MAG: CorA family divalent cation transporter [Lachnospiraceae bacterium]